VSDYREVCATPGLRVRATVAGGGIVEGEAEEVDEHGGLVVRTADGIRVIRFGAIEHLE